jgi:serine/threonine protein kinase
MLSKIQSPSIVEYKCHGKSKKNDVYWIIMERLQGKSLDNLFDKLEECPLSETEAILVR